MYICIYNPKYVETGSKLSKRVIALEGEYVRIKHGKIYVNDKVQEDPYGKGDIIYYLEDKEEQAKKPKHEWLFHNTDQDVGLIPKGYVFVIGDNRNISIIKYLYH